MIKLMDKLNAVVLSKETFSAKLVFFYLGCTCLSLTAYVLLSFLSFFLAKLKHERRHLMQN